MTGGELELLQAGCRELGIDLRPGQHADLLTFVDQIYVWNRLAGLTTIPRSNAIRLHVLDSLAAVPFVGAGPCLDIGTGAGLPGMVLAIAEPSVSFVLVESNRKRCSFLAETAQRLSLKNVEIVQADVRQFSPARRYPVVVSRAFRPPAEFVSIARNYLEPDGRVVLLMADPQEPELRDLESRTGFRVEDLKRFRLPIGGEPRTIASLALEAVVSRET